MIVFVIFSSISHNELVFGQKSLKAWTHHGLKTAIGDEISSFKRNSCHHRRQNWKMFSLLTNSKPSWQYWPLRVRRVQNRGSYCSLLAMLHHLINLLCQSKYWETHGLQSVMRQGSTVQIRLLNKICEHIMNAPWATELTALIFGKFVSLKSFISPLHKCFIEQNEMKMKGREQTEQ